MNEQAQDLCLLYDLRRGEVADVALRLSDALEEDYRVNADMFDITRTTFSQNRHPNATMRALESDLERADLPLLRLLVALSQIGMEAAQGLGDFPDRAAFASAAGEEFARLERMAAPAHQLAHTLTEIKAEHALKRLGTAITYMERL